MRHLILAALLALCTVAGQPLKGTATALRDKYLPDYPQRDDTPFDATLLDAPQ